MDTNAGDQSTGTRNKTGRRRKQFAGGASPHFGEAFDSILSLRCLGSSHLVHLMQLHYHDRYFDDYANGRRKMPAKIFSRLIALDLWTKQERRALRYAYLQDLYVDIEPLKRTGRSFRPLVAIGPINYDVTIPRTLALGDNYREPLPWSFQDDLVIPSSDDFDRREQELYERLDPDRTSVRPPTGGGSSYLTIRTVGYGLPHERVLGFVGVEGDPPTAECTAAPIDELRTRAGVQTTFVCRVSGERAGRVLSLVKPVGERNVARSLQTTPGANRHLGDYVLRNFDKIVDYVASSERIHVSSLYDDWSPDVLALLLETARRRNPELAVSFDPGHVWANSKLDSVQRILNQTQMLFVTEDELRKLAEHYTADYMPLDNEEELAQKTLSLLSGRAGMVLVVKHVGRAGVHVRGGSRQILLGSSLVEAPEDDTGAGDVFAAGVLIALIKGESVDSGVRLGMKLAKRKLQCIGPLAEQDIRTTVMEHLPLHYPRTN